MASGLEALVGAATEGMRKTQSAEEMAQTQGADMQPLRAPDGHLSDSAAAPTRERKKGASLLFRAPSDFIFARVGGSAECVTGRRIRRRFA